MIRRPPRSTLFPYTRSSDLEYPQERTNKTEDAIHRCVQYHLITALAHDHEWTPEDRLIHTAVKSVLSYICTNFFYMRSLDRKSTRLNSSHANISYAVFCLKK